MNYFIEAPSSRFPADNLKANGSGAATPSKWSSSAPMRDFVGLQHTYMMLKQLKKVLIVVVSFAQVTVLWKMPQLILELHEE